MIVREYEVMDGCRSHDGAVNGNRDSPSFLADDVDGFGLGESVLLHGRANLVGEVRDLVFGVAFLSGNSGGLADGCHKEPNKIILYYYCTAHLWYHCESVRPISAKYWRNYLSVCRILPQEKAEKGRSTAASLRQQ